MIELIQEYWRNYLYTDGYRFTGVAITLWLLVVSIGLGFCLSIPLAVARVSKKKWLSFPPPNAQGASISGRKHPNSAQDFGP